MTDLSKPIGSRMDALREYVRRLPQGARILETGTMRGTTPGHITGDGWSTAILAYEIFQKGGRICTIDIHDRHAVLDEAIPDPIRGCVDHFVGDTKEMLPGLMAHRWAMVLLDSHRDPEVALKEFALIEGSLVPGAYLALDDHKVKGRLLVPHLKKLGWRCLREEDPQVWKL